VMLLNWVRRRGGCRRSWPAVVWAATFFIVLGAGCGGSTAEPEPPPPSDSDRLNPFVTMVEPEPGETGVPTGAPIQVVFSEPMDRDSVARALAISPETAVDVSWPDDRTLLLRPQAEWPQDVAVTVRIDVLAHDTSGDTLTEPCEWSFVTGSDLLVVQDINPPDGATGVEGDRPLILSFNRDIDAASVDGGVAISPYTPGEFQVSGRTVTFRPEVGWAPSTTYTVTLRTGAFRGVRDTSGQPLAVPAEFYFTTRARCGVWSVGVDGSDPQRLFTLEDQAVGVVWAPDGAGLVLLVQEEPGELDPWGFFGEIWLAKPDGTGLRRVEGPLVWTESTDLNAMWAPDGSRFLCADAGGQEETGGVWQVTADGRARPLIPVDTPGVKAANPVWSEDGSRVAWRLYGDWQSRIFVAAASGAGAREAAAFDVTVSEYGFRSLHWLPGSDGLVADEEDPSQQAMCAWRVPLGTAAGDEGTAKPERLVVGWRHDVSPDGRLLALVRDGVLYVHEIATGRDTVAACIEGYLRWGPVWSPDGAYVAYEAAADYTGAAAGFFIARPDGTGATRLTNLPTWGAKGWAPDGRSLVFLSLADVPGSS